MEVDAAFLHELAQALGDVTVEGWQTLLQVFDDRHLGAEALKDGGELHADDARTDDGEALGLLLQGEQTGAVHDARVGPDALYRQPLGLGACGDDDVWGGVGFVCCDGIATNGMRTDERGLAPDQGDVRMREDGLDTLTQLGHDGGHALAGLVEALGVDVGLRGDAADIETGAPDGSFLEEGHLQSLLGGVFSSAVTAWTRTDDDQISFHDALHDRWLQGVWQPAHRRHDRWAWCGAPTSPVPGRSWPPRQSVA